MKIIDILDKSATTMKRKEFPDNNRLDKSVPRKGKTFGVAFRQNPFGYIMAEDLLCYCRSIGSSVCWNATSIELPVDSHWARIKH